MATPQWLQISETELIAMGVSSLVKITREDNALRFQHSDGTVTETRYADFTAAKAALTNYAAITEAGSPGEPQIASIIPSSVDQATLPQNITVTGVAFDVSAVIVLQNYSGDTALVTVGTPTSTTIVATIPNTMGKGTYDVLYTDSNGKTDRFPSGMVLF